MNNKSHAGLIPDGQLLTEDQVMIRVVLAITELKSTNYVAKNSLSLGTISFIEYVRCHTSSLQDRFMNLYSVSEHTIRHHYFETE